MLQLTSKIFKSQFNRIHSEPQLIVHTVNTELFADSTIPVSLILGFGGAKRKHIEKYADIYKEEGIPCISYTGDRMWDNVPKPDEGTVFAPLYEHPSYRDRKLIIHTISLNGFRSLAKLYSWMDQKTLNEDKFAGIVFDSCPSVPHLQSIMHGISATHPPPIFGQYAWLPQVMYRSAVSSAIAQFQPEMLSSRLLYHYIMEECQLPFHQHYIYSKVDELIDYKHVEDFIAGQKAKGRHVTSRRYEDTPHVRHITADSLGYQEQVVNLIKRSTKKRSAE